MLYILNLLTRQWITLRTSIEITIHNIASEIRIFQNNLFIIKCEIHPTSCWWFGLTAKCVRSLHTNPNIYHSLQIVAQSRFNKTHLMFFIFSASFPTNPRQKSRVRFVISVCLPVEEWRVLIVYYNVRFRTLICDVWWFAKFGVSVSSFNAA